MNPDGTFRVNTDAFKPNVLGLTRHVMTMPATGDPAAARAMAEEVTAHHLEGVDQPGDR